MKTPKAILGATIVTVILAMQLTHCDVQNQYSVQTPYNETNRPFVVNIPHAELKALRKRILKTELPKKEIVTDHSQSVQLATMQKLADYWVTAYDCRKIEAKLNVIPQFITNIDSLDIHFIHVKSNHIKALPLIITHGWRARSLAYDLTSASHFFPFRQCKKPPSCIYYQVKKSSDFLMVRVLE